MKSLSDKINEFCNPFDEEVPGTLVNLATGRAANKETEKYLLETMDRGQTARKQFEDEWQTEPARFLKAVKRMKVQNFAAENEKKRKKANIPATEKAKRNAESLRDMFIRIIIVVAENTNFDLRRVMSYPITPYPLSMAHADAALLKLVKTSKSALLKKLEEAQTEKLTEAPTSSSARIYDGGLLIHSTLSTMNPGTLYGSVARSILSRVCTGAANEVHVCLDKYVTNSIKDSERKLRGAEDSAYSITGAEQTLKQKGDRLLKNGTFKDALGRFLLKEWGKSHYHNILNGRTLYASYGGECTQYMADNNQIIVSNPTHLQANHEEADTLIAFHLVNITASNVLVRASDTDVLIILVGIVGSQRPEVRANTQVIMDCGDGNTRRFINVTNIVEELEARQPGLPRAMPAVHAFTGCDFTSAFCR